MLFSRMVYFICRHYLMCLLICLMPCIERLLAWILVAGLSYWLMQFLYKHYFHYPVCMVGSSEKTKKITDLRIVENFTETVATPYLRACKEWKSISFSKNIFCCMGLDLYESTSYFPARRTIQNVDHVFPWNPSICDLSAKVWIPCVLFSAFAPSWCKKNQKARVSWQ